MFGDCRAYTNASLALERVKRPLFFNLHETLLWRLLTSPSMYHASVDCPQSQKMNVAHEIAMLRVSQGLMQRLSITLLVQISLLELTGASLCEVFF
jgi:hypothetical protein